MSGFRLSPQQKHLFRHGPGFAAGAGRTLCLVRFEGSPDIEAVRSAMLALVERYEILRTVFPPIAGLDVPLQTPLDSARIELLPHDLRQSENRTQDSTIDAVVRTALQRPFDLSSLPLQRMDVVALDTAGHLLLWTQPTLCGDADSLAYLMRELGATLAGTPGPLTADKEPLQYADLAEWLNEILEGDDAAEGLDYWRRQLAGVPSFTLPFVDHGPAHSFQPARVRVPLDVQTAAALEELAAGFGTSFENVLQAAWAGLLARYGNSDRLVVGTAVGGRSHKDLELAVGLFAKHLPINVSCDEGTTFEELSARLATAHSDAIDWQEYFCWDHLGRNVLVGQPPQLEYLYEHTDLQPVRGVEGLRPTIERLESHSDRYAIKLSTSRTDKGHKADLWFDAGRFDRPPIARLAASLGSLLRDVTQRPQAEISTLCLTPPQESRRVLYGLNPKRVQAPTGHSVLELIARQVTTRHSHIAVSCGAERLTYGELWDRTAAIAHHLNARGIGCESLVAICSERSVDMVAAILGVLRAGAAYLPIDPGYPAGRRDFMLQDARVSAVLTQSRLADRFSGHHDVICVDSLCADGIEVEPKAGPQRHQLAYVIYTSGSTGRPKGVAVSHGNLLASTEARFSFYKESPESFLLLSSYAFDSSVAGLFWTLTTGGTLLLPQEGDEQDIVLLSQLIEQMRVTHTLCLPTLYALLLDQVDAARLSSIRTVMVAGETCPVSLAQAHFKALPRCVLVNEYGPTEATVWATASQVSAEHREHRVPIGRPVGNTCVYLLDGSMRPVPAGVAGEMYIGGPGVARGYLHRPGQTAERFVPDPFSGDAGARLYRTGDRARYTANDTLEFLGRMDHQVKIRGYRIEPEEIESRLAAHPLVHQAAVVAVADHLGGQRLAAYYSTRGSSAPARSELLDFLRGQLPDFMIPAVFMALHAIPLMPNGKVDREALPEPDQTRPDVGAEYVEPRGPLEVYLAERWRDILRADSVGAHDNFFELGGNSIQAAIFMNRLRGDLNEFIHVGKLFENPTIHQLAEHLAEEHASASANLAAGSQAPRHAAILPPREQRVLEQLDDLSDEQVDSLLHELLPQNTSYPEKGTKQ